MIFFSFLNGVFCVWVMQSVALLDWEVYLSKEGNDVSMFKRERVFFLQGISLEKKQIQKESE